MHRKSEVIELTSKLSFRHYKIIRRYRLLLKTRNAKYWSEIKDEIMALKKMEKQKLK
jgi:hypothetical protein